MNWTFPTRLAKAWRPRFGHGLYTLLGASLAGLALLSLGGCALGEEPVSIPAYVEIRGINVIRPEGDTVASTAEQGSPDNWLGPRHLALFERSQEAGRFEIPAILPITDPDLPYLIVRGGVAEAGAPLTRNRRIYPFWRNDTIFVDLEPEQNQRITPYMTYWPDSVLGIPLSESFEGGQSLFQDYPIIDPETLVPLSTTSEEAFRGARSLVARFDSNKTGLSLITSNFFPLPQEDTEVWLELTYKGDIQVGVGMQYQQPGQAPVDFDYVIPVEQVREDIWQTRYFNLTTFVRTAPLGSLFRLKLLSVSNGSARTLYLDDLRILHFLPR